MGKTFDKSNVYHSVLVKNGPTTIRLKGAPMRSKFPKEGASHVAYFTCPDDATEYTLIVEDAALDSLAQIPADRWVTVEAVGSRESADILWATPDHEPVERSAPERTQAPATGTSQPLSMNLHALIDKMLRQCIETIDEVAPDASADARIDCATRLAASVFIEHNRRT